MRSGKRPSVEGAVWQETPQRGLWSWDVRLYLGLDDDGGTWREGVASTARDAARDMGEAVEQCLADLRARSLAQIRHLRTMLKEAR